MSHTRMTVVEIERPGGPEVLVPGEREVPKPGPADVLIRVAAAGVNRPDVMQRQGKYPPPAGTTDIPGLEVAGTVEAHGDAVARWRVGDRICALVVGGGYAEYCVAPARHCLPVPDGLDMVSAAAIPETFFTVWTNVFERGALQDGETLLVHGGSSGIGTTAIQLARAFGARVFATAGSPEKCQACESLGAERCVNYRTDDFVLAMAALTNGRGIDVILDMVGGEYVARNLATLAMHGRLVQIAVLGGARAEINLIPVLQRRLILTGSTLRPRSLEEKAAIADALETSVWPLINSGTVTPIIHATYPLVEAAAAHRAMEEGLHVGKLVLRVEST